MPTQNLLRLFNSNTVADVDENCVGNNILQVWKLRFGHKGKFGPDFQHNVWSGFEVGVQARFYGEKIFHVGKKLVKLSTLATLVTH